jgi:hypothetical protein
MKTRTALPYSRLTLAVAGAFGLAASASAAPTEIWHEPHAHPVDRRHEGVGELRGVDLGAELPRRLSGPHEPDEELAKRPLDLAEPALGLRSMGGRNPPEVEEKPVDIEIFVQRRTDHLGDAAPQGGLRIVGHARQDLGIEGLARGVEHQRREEVLLAPEVLVERALADLGARRDVAHAGGPVAPADEHRSRRRQDRTAALEAARPARHRRIVEPTGRF